MDRDLGVRARCLGTRIFIHPAGWRPFAPAWLNRFPAKGQHGGT